MPTSKSSGRSSRSKASSARKASSTRKSAGTSESDVREQVRRFLDPREVVVVTRERLQEALDEAV